MLGKSVHSDSESECEPAYGGFSVFLIDWDSFLAFNLVVRNE